MINNALVSILMPAYNAEKFISESIESILNQDHSNWELLILDDASTDSTLEMIKTFVDDRIKVLTHETNIGYLLSCNELFEKATGDFVTFLDADDTCEPNRISACLLAFESDSELDFLTTDHSRTDEFGKLLFDHHTEVDYHRYATDPPYYPIICCATIFLERKLLQQVGGYHPFFQEIGGEDYHWLFRLSTVGKGKHLSENLYNYRQHASQVHVLNPNPLKYFTKDIDQELRLELMRGNDLLVDHRTFMQKWLVRVEEDASELYFRMAAEALNRHHSSEFVRLLWKGLASSPHTFGKLKTVTYLMYSYFARIA